MDLGGRRRMKAEGVKVGIKVFNSTHHNSQVNTTTTTTSTVKNTEVKVDQKAKSMRPKQSLLGVNGKIKTRKSESVECSPVQISRQRSELSKNSDEKRKELSVSSDGNGVKRSPVRIKKTRTASLSPPQKGAADPTSDGNEMSLVLQLRKAKSDSSESLVDIKSYDRLRTVKSDTGNSLALQLVRAKAVVARTVSDDEDGVIIVGESNSYLEGSEKSPVGNNEPRSDEDCKEVSVCEEEGATGNVDQIIGTPPDFDYVNGGEDEEVDKRIGAEEKGGLDVKEINVNDDDHKPVIEDKKSVSSNEKPAPISSIVKKQALPALNHARIQPTPARTKPISDHFNDIPSTQSKLQSFVDLIMWRDVSKSAFIFGVGAFLIISTSYTKDLNISIVSVLSYIGLVYLAAVFLFKSLITRVATDVDETEEEYVVGEEEAVKVVRLVLPYVNEFLVKLRALFSGDPATTIKLAVILFILARCGGSITIWRMAKLGFFGVFTVPKVCSSYSSQLTAYGIFWIRRLGDGWESCSHKKAVGFGVFTLVWNLSSVVARIWTLFVVFVAFKYYHQHRSFIKEEELLVATSNSTSHYTRGRTSSTNTHIKKQNKAC
ncbi:Reticulon-like protein B21 [Sesamum alatum]|uniref:Reticulon-like protein n=1 Tax=Sesamum alatum TaxID=300844 RepID=A0AAE1XPG0_9LAMI|nr:Reticulon-like protein B21 [Sesamum alatum]